MSTLRQRRPSMAHPAYLEYVRAQPCCGCGFAGRQHAHHNIANRFSSAKVSDVCTMPLCGPCHAELHADWPAWEAKHGTQSMHVEATFEQAVRDGVFNIDNKAARFLGS